MLDPICIRAEWLGSTGQKWAGWFLHIGLLPGRICLSKIWHNQPELNQIWAGFAQYYPGLLWKKETEAESGETGSWPIAFCQKQGPMIPAHRLDSRRNVFDQILIKLSRSDPGRFCTIWSMPSLQKRNGNRCGKLDPAYTIPVSYTHLTLPTKSYV